jgi:hypothetical protein
VLGGKGHRIDRAIVLIGASDDVVFHQVHVRLLLCLKTLAPLKDEHPASPVHFFHSAQETERGNPERRGPAMGSVA